MLTRKCAKMIVCNMKPSLLSPCSRSPASHDSRSSRVAMFLTLAALTVSAQAQTITMEAENGTLLGGVRVTTAVSGYSGTGYLTNFTNDNCRVSWNFTNPGGLYTLLVRFRSPYGDKRFYAYINGFALDRMFPQTTSFATVRRRADPTRLRRQYD